MFSNPQKNLLESRPDSVRFVSGWLIMTAPQHHPIISWRLSKSFFLGFENMGDMGWAGNALFGPWGGVTWAQLRYAGDSQFAWGGHEKAEKRPRV